MVTNGEAYNQYLTARGLIRTRKYDVFVTASNLLRDAINLDPNYAPAWASLAKSTYFEDYPDASDGLIAALPKADGYARRALQLAPDLADGHRVLALLLPYGSPAALSHYRRAVELDPNSAEALLGLGSALAAAGEFDAQIAAYKRARELDPLWFRTTGQTAIALAEMGRRSEAEAIGRQGFVNNEPNLHIILGRIAWIFGDFSEAARHWSITARANSPRWTRGLGWAWPMLGSFLVLTALRPGTNRDLASSAERPMCRPPRRLRRQPGRCAIAMRQRPTLIATIITWPPS